MTITEELWFTDIAEKVFSFKHKVHNWLREEDEMQRTEKKIKIIIFQIYKLQVIIQIIKFQIIEAINRAANSVIKDRRRNGKSTSQS